MKTLAGRSAAVALLVTLALAPVAVLAQDATSTQLTLRDAVKQALERNLDIKIQRIDPLRTAEQITISEAGFDPLFTASLRHDESEQEQTSSFSSLGDTTDAATLSYVDPNQAGGEFRAEFGYTDTATDFPQAAIDEFGFVPDQTRGSLSLTYTQSLLKDFGLEINRIGIEQSRNNLRVSESQLKQRVIDTIEQTVQGYWNLVGARKQLEVARQSLDLAKQFLEQTKIKVEVGTLPPIEVTTAEATVASREEGVITAETTVGNAEDLLRRLIRVPDDSLDWQRTLVPSDEPGFSPKDIDLEAAIATALEKRPDIEQAQINLRNAELGEKFRRNQTRADLDLSATYSSTGNNFDYSEESVSQTITLPGPDGMLGTADDIEVTQTSREFVPSDEGKSGVFSEIPDLENTFWTVQLTYTLPIRNRTNRAEYARAKLLVNQNELSLESTMLGARVEVRNAVRTLESNARRVAAARANVVLQRKKLEAEQKRYENGLSTAYQVLEFQEDLAEAESSLISAIVDYNNAEVTLLKAQGNLLEETSINWEGSGA
jgi:outer membrane protein TolC